MGCTGNILLITPDHFICANAGDTRAVLKNGQTAISLSFDLKPDDLFETERIVASGKKVLHGKVDGVLGVSRAFGDFRFKKNPDLAPENQAVSPFPDVLIRPRHEDDEFIVIACDGIWDCLTCD